MAIGQPPFLESLPYLVPLAVRVLQDNPLAEGAFYGGDLLENVLKRPDEYFDWDKNSASLLTIVAQHAETLLKKEIDLDSTDRHILVLIAEFVKKHSPE